MNGIWDRRIVGLLVALILLVAAPASAQVSDSAAKKIVSDAVRAAGGSDALAGNPAKIAATLRLVASNLNAADPRPDHWGVLQKTSGTQCSGLSCDIICTGDGTAQTQYDVLAAAGDPGGSRPTWTRLDTIAVRPCVVVAGASTPTPPTPPASDDVLAALAKLSAAVAALQSRIDAMSGKLDTISAASLSAAQLAADIKAIVSVGTGVPADLPPYKGSWGFITIVSTPCPECAR